MSRIAFYRLAGLVGLLFAAGTLYRLFPIVTGRPALSEFFMTEDGYLMLTVARNIAMGLGMSVSDGTITTNGVQPLATFLFTLPYLQTGGDKVTSLIGIHLIMAAWSVAGFFLVRALAARILDPGRQAPALPWIAALLWYLSPLLVLHMMNGLETGLYSAAVLAVLLMFLRLLRREGPLGWGWHLGFGLMGGIAFLARIDAVFLLLAVYLVWAIDGLFLRRDPIRTVAARILPSGLISILVAAPWLLNNQIRFGSIMPISGTAQSMAAEFGQNLGVLPVKIFEYVMPMLPVPNPLEKTLPVILLASAVSLVVLAWFLIGVFTRASRPVRLMVLAYLLFGAMVSGYYGLWFGAPHFMSRYLAPLAPLCIIASLWVLADLSRWLFPARGLRPAIWTGSAAIGLCVLLLGRLLMPGVQEQGHMQVVDWVERNVPDSAWVAAVQTGTLGYWHDRTINLDGKVNPEALEARRRAGNVLAYVVNSRIDYIADWYGVGGWATRTDGGFAEAFELIEHRKSPSLAVMRRRVLHDPG
ncbi:hypothetical protein [Rhodovulum sulfidophilum]|uniref:hypothetical protein n=1 Tax=Rhodovulum sulfidophilum TaxID=35806 RepID=UPI001F472C9C|nr:hypothetical protein [Rhodovulum sulfidophilum]